MNPGQIRSNINKLVNDTNNEQVLLAVQDLLISGNKREGQLWASLSAAQQQQVLLAFDESEDEQNLIDPDLVFGNS